MSPVVSAQRVATLVADFPRSPAYVGLADSLRVLIGDGRIGIGVRLPSERELTSALVVARGPVARAYEGLRERFAALAVDHDGWYDDPADPRPPVTAEDPG